MSSAARLSVTCLLVNLSLRWAVGLQFLLSAIRGPIIRHFCRRTRKPSYAKQAAQIIISERSVEFARLLTIVRDVVKN